jgi:hypothetical protein
VPSEYGPLLRGPVAVTLAGVRFLVPYRPAAMWAPALGHVGSLAALLAEPEDRDEMAELLLTHPSARAELERESLRILEEACARNWWEAARLINTAVNGEVLGRMVLAGVDPWTRSVGEWCAAVYALCVKGQDEKGRIKFDFTLSVPPPGYEDAWDDGGSSDPMEFLASLKR